jgi:uncharacterized protein (DUF362 family)
VSVVDTLVGIYHFLGDRAPGDIPEVAPRPQRENPWRRDGRPLVSRVKAGKDLKSSIAKTLDHLGGLSKAIARGDNVLVKPNFNSPDRSPMATDLPFLGAVVELLLDAGAKVTIGESAGGVWRPSRKGFEKLGALALARWLGVEFIIFEERPADWVRVKIDGNYLKSVIMPRSAYEADKLIYLPCIKTHFLGRYSGSLKLAMGFMHPGQRRVMHIGHLEQKIAEISLCWRPDLIITDGRKALVTGGPTSGKVVEPGILMASGDMVANDVESVNIILSYKTKNRLSPDPWQLPQIATALKYGLGAGKDGYAVVE